MNIFKLLSVLFLAFLIRPCSAFSGECTLNTLEYVENGIKRVGNYKVNTEAFFGYGTIICDYMTMECDDFNFTGCIICNKECKIYCSKPFDVNMFRKSGPGNFLIIIVNKNCNETEDKQIIQIPEEQKTSVNNLPEFKVYSEDEILKGFELMAKELKELFFSAKNK